MMDKIWISMIAVSVVAAVMTGRIGELSSAVTTGAQAAVELSVAILGTMCFWRGLMEVMRANGCAEALRRMLLPLIRRLFPRLADPKRAAAEETLSAYVAANVMGLGNAATPFGIAAAKLLHDGSDTATDGLCTLAILGSASVQLIPTTVAAVRAGLGCATPYDILPAVWISSAVSVAVGLLGASCAAAAGRGRV